ncbi:MAG TPA: DNA polymerase III subunit delta [Gaiellaceae bacterium]
MADLKPAYLLTGSDRPKITRALRRLRERIGADATELLSALEVGGEEVAASCNALGLFATERRLVVVEQVEAWKARETEPLVAYLGSPSPETVLALVGEGLKKDSPLAKAVAKAGEVLVYELPKRGSRPDLPGWVGRQFAGFGIRVEPSVCRLIVELVGDDLEELTGEVEKLAAWANGDAIGEREVELLVAARAEAPPFALTDAWGRRDLAAVLEASERLLARAGTPARDALPRIVGLLTSHVTRVAECHALAAEGVPARQAAEQLKRNRYYVEKLYAQAANFTPDELRGAIVRLAELDLALKGGSRLAGELEFDRALIDLTRPREPALR